jgi:excisionase family DNA binding protein
MSEIKWEHQIKFHEPWCVETAGLGMCNCSPKIIPPTGPYSWIRDGELTCGMCGHSSKGEIKCQNYETPLGNSIELLSITGGDTFYGLMVDESKIIFLCNDCLIGDLILAEDVCEQTGFDLTTVYQMARSGEIPGAVWGETLGFKREEYKKWWRSEIEAITRELEEEGFLTSFIDSDGKRRYILPKYVQ